MEANCLQKFKFIAVKSQSGEPFKYDGTVGLAPNIAENGISFLEALYNDGKISDMVVSIFMTRSLLARSYVQMGGYSPEKIRNDSVVGDGLHWYETTSKKHWQIRITDLIVDGKSIFTDTTEKAVIKTGSPYIEIPYRDFTNLIEKLQSMSIEGLDCSTEPPVIKIAGTCSKAAKNLKSVGFVFGDEW